MNKQSEFKRVLLKLSGEALANGSETEIFDFDYINKIAEAVKCVSESGCQTAIVVGAGNIWRGKYGKNMDKVRADDMGMLATTINAIALRDVLLSAGVDAVAMTSVMVSEFADLYTRDAAVSAMENGKVVIIGGGLGLPFFSTDTATVLRSKEIEADITLMGKNVDGVYDSDPGKNKDAVMYDRLTYDEILYKNLQAIDYTASAFAKDNKMTIRVFGINDPMNIYRVVTGESLGTLITAE